MMVNSATELTRSALLANTTYRIASTFELDNNAAIRGTVGTTIQCINIDVCLRAKGAITVSNVQILYTGGPPVRTFLLANNNSVVNMSNVTLSPSSATGFTLLAGVGDMAVTMRDVTLRNCALINGSDATVGQTIAIDLARVNVTSANNIIVLGGGAQGTNRDFRIADSELGGSAGNSVLVRLGSADLNATYRDFVADRTVFRSGVVDLRLTLTAKFTDTTHIGSSVTSSSRDVNVLRSQFRTMTTAAWTVNRAVNVRFDQIDMDVGRQLLSTNNVTLDDMKIYNVLVSSPSTAYLIDFTGNGTLKNQNSAIQNVTMRSCLLARLSGNGLAMRNITIRDIPAGSMPSNTVVFGNVTNLNATDWTVDNASCATLLEFAGRTVQSSSVTALTMTASSLTRVLAVTNQSDGALTFARISADSMKLRKLFTVDASNSSLRLTLDTISVTNTSLQETMLQVRTDEPVLLSNLLWRSVNLSTHGINVDGALVDSLTLFNLSAVDVLQTAPNAHFVSVSTSPHVFALNASRLSFENCTCGFSVLAIQTMPSGMRGAAVVDDFTVQNVRISSANGNIIRLGGNSLNANLTRINMSDSDAPLLVSAVNSMQLLGARFVRARGGGVVVLNSQTAIVRDFEFTDSTTPCASGVAPFLFSTVVNVTLSSVWAARLRCAGGSGSVTMSASIKTLLLSNVTFIDSAVPVLYFGTASDNVTIDGCRFEGNVNATAGSVVHFVGSAQVGSVVIANSVFLDNVAANVGVLFLPTNSDLAVSRSQFFNNSAQSQGVLYAASASVAIDQCVFRDNAALNGTSGVLYVNNGRVNVSNSDFVGNRATLSIDVGSVASALLVYQGRASFTNVTVRENTLKTPQYRNTYGALYVHYLAELALADVCVCDNLHGVGNAPLARTDLGCLGNLSPSNAAWSIRTVLANASDCLLFANATCPRQCALRVMDRFQMPSRTTTLTTTTTVRRTVTMLTASSSSSSSSSSSTNASSAGAMAPPAPVPLSSPKSFDSTGMIVGIVLGALAFVGIVAVVGALVVRRRKQARAEEPNSASTASPSASSTYGSVRGAMQQQQPEFVSARDEYGSLAHYQKGFDTDTSGTEEPHYNSTFRMLD